MERWSSRTELLLGEMAFARLQKASVLVVGVGGVGAVVAEMLARAGVGFLTLVDGDRVGLSNCNRQLNALTSTLGRLKVQVTGERLTDVNPDLQLTLISEFVDEKGMSALLESTRFDFVVDAIDTLAPKVQLLYSATTANIKVVSSMGAGARVHPEQVCLTDISKTHQCALAKAVRRELGLRGIKRGIPVVFSIEPAVRSAVRPSIGERNKKSMVGTVSYMPAVFGCHLAAYVINALISSEGL